jgi:hypothetical protein
MGQKHGRQLVTERFSGSGGENCSSGLACQYFGDNILLSLEKRAKAEKFFQVLIEHNLSSNGHCQTLTKCPPSFFNTTG